MQWKSLILFLAAADAALARGHGRQRGHNLRRHAHPGQVAGEHHLNARGGNVVDVTNVRTVVDVEVVTVTTTVIGHAPAATSTSTTLTTTAAPPPAQTTSQVEAEINETVVNHAKNQAISVSVGVTVSAQETSPSSTSTAVAQSSSTVSSDSSSWASVPSTGQFSTSGFGASTNSSGSGISYAGNVGNPWGSNIIEVSESDASQYKYVVQISGSNTEDWTVVFWNKVGPDGKLDGWYGHSAVNFSLAAGETRYVAFAENSQGAWGAAAGDSLPTDDYGGYSCTWGEFDFGDTNNGGWSGWDVSAIQAQSASQTVQGMKICSHTGDKCSYITTDAAEVVNAYTKSEKEVDGIGGSVSSGAVRLKVHVDYSG